MNDLGQSTVADVIKGCDWILANKAKYNIQVANFSLHAVNKASIMFDPLDQAVEKLWFSGVVVVAAAGNYGTDPLPSGVLFAPVTTRSLRGPPGATRPTGSRSLTSLPPVAT